MRRFLFLFMVVLLVLRGLVGDAMALQKTVQPAALMPGASAAVKSLSAGHGMHDMAQMQSMDEQGHCATEDGRGNLHADHGGPCGLCGICHSAVAAPQWQGLCPARLAAAQPVHGAERFASAAPAELVKPPIFVV